VVENRLVFKIVPETDWQKAVRAGRFAGSPIDVQDGFIHLSAAHQAKETARRHFAGQTGLLLVAFRAADLSALRWEPSRGGDLFPHLHAALDPGLALWAKPLPWRGDGHDFPEGFAA